MGLYFGIPKLLDGKPFLPHACCCSGLCQIAWFDGTDGGSGYIEDVVAPCCARLRFVDESNQLQPLLNQKCCNCEAIPTILYISLHRSRPDVSVDEAPLYVGHTCNNDDVQCAPCGISVIYYFPSHGFIVLENGAVYTPDPSGDILFANGVDNSISYFSNDHTFEYNHDLTTGKKLLSEYENEIVPDAPNTDISNYTPWIESESQTYRPYLGGGFSPCACVYPPKILIDFRNGFCRSARLTCEQCVPSGACYCADISEPSIKFSKIEINLPSGYDGSSICGEGWSGADILNCHDFDVDYVDTASIWHGTSPYSSHNGTQNIQSVVGPSLTFTFMRFPWRDGNGSRIIIGDAIYDSSENLCLIEDEETVTYSLSAGTEVSELCEIDAPTEIYVTFTRDTGIQNHCLNNYWANPCRAYPSNYPEGRYIEHDSSPNVTMVPYHCDSEVPYDITLTINESFGYFSGAPCEGVYPPFSTCESIPSWCNDPANGKLKITGARVSIESWVSDSGFCECSLPTGIFELAGILSPWEWTGVYPLNKKCSCGNGNFSHAGESLVIKLLLTQNTGGTPTILLSSKYTEEIFHYSLLGGDPSDVIYYQAPPLSGVYCSQDYLDFTIISSPPLQHSDCGFPYPSGIRLYFDKDDAGCIQNGDIIASRRNETFAFWEMPNWSAQGPYGGCHTWSYTKQDFQKSDLWQLNPRCPSHYTIQVTFETPPYIVGYQPGLDPVASGLDLGSGCAIRIDILDSSLGGYLERVSTGRYYFSPDILFSDLGDIMVGTSESVVESGVSYRVCYPTCSFPSGIISIYLPPDPVMDGNASCFEALCVWSGGYIDVDFGL